MSHDLQNRLVRGGVFESSGTKCRGKGMRVTAFGRYLVAPPLPTCNFRFVHQVAADSDVDEDDVFDMDNSDEDSDDAPPPAKGKGKAAKGKGAAGKVLTKRGSAAGGAKGKGKGKAATTPAKSTVR